MLLHGGLMASYDIEPFLPSYGKKATNSSYPHSDSPLPVSSRCCYHSRKILTVPKLNVYFAWSLDEEDQFWYDAIRTSVTHLKNVAISEGIYVETRYPNYAISGTTAQQLYGVQNAQRLQRIRKEMDPDRVMELAGGFAI